MVTPAASKKFLFQCTAYAEHSGVGYDALYLYKLSN